MNLDEYDERRAAFDAWQSTHDENYDDNYKNYDEGFSCVHVAVLNNQIGQVELLNIFGADLTALDRNGNSAYDLAKMNGFNAIADRLQEIQFELTDEFAYFLCSKRTDHKSAQHIHIPDLNERLAKFKIKYFSCRNFFFLRVFKIILLICLAKRQLMHCHQCLKSFKK